jgi:hypothetical protein
MKVQTLWLGVIGISLAALASQPFWPEAGATGKPMPRIVMPGVYSGDRCYTCGCKGGPGWRVRLTGQCAGWRTLKEQCGDPPSRARCSKES